MLNHYPIRPKGCNRLLGGVFAAILCLFAQNAFAGRTFNGSTDVASVNGNGTAVQLTGGTGVTLAFWMYMPSVPAVEANPVSKGSNSNGTEEYYVSVSESGHTNHVAAHFYQSQILNHTVDVYCDGVTLLANTWYSVVAVWSSATGADDVYLNGTFCVTSRLGTSVGTLSNPGGGEPNLCMGGHATTGTPGACTVINFAGTIAEVAVWNIGLTAGEASSLGNGAPPSLVHANTLVGYWPLYGISSPEVDLSGGKLNATLSGTAATNHAPVRGIQ